MHRLQLVRQQWWMHQILLMESISITYPIQGGGAMSDTGGTCACGGSCGCGGHHDEVEEVFLTREQYIARLEQYLGELKAEIQAVETELVELRQTA
jgi:hypothetical protein